jgi:glycerophosphoryl diester phosphodiesterase
VWRPRTWLGRLLAAFGIGVALAFTFVVILGLGVFSGPGFMGRVCPDAKAVAPQNTAALQFFTGLPRVVDIAHRGASTLMPEHSSAAYELALTQGADVLELDLRLTRDGVLLVAHDSTLKRTLGLDASVSELTVPELQRLAGARMPQSLEQVFSRFPTARLNLELKDESNDAARALAELIARQRVGGRVLVASVHQAVLEEFRKATGGAVATSASAKEALGYIVSDLMLPRPCPAAYSALQLPALGWLGVTRRGFIERAHERGLAVHFWTIDDAGRMRALVDAGADGIMTNRPDLLAQVLGRR